MTDGGRQPVVRQVLDRANQTPDKTAILSPDRRLTYGQLAGAVRSRIATLAGEFGIAAGDRIVLAAGSHADFVSTYLAVHAIGAICVPLDPHSAPARMADVIRRVAPKLVVTETARQPESRDHLTFDELQKESGSEAAGSPPALPDAGRTADVLFTTGTTGRSKGVVLSHGALSTACAHINAFIGTPGDAVEVLPLPLSHSFGLGRVRCVLTLGATLVLVPGFVNAGAIFRAFAEHDATGFASVPSGFAILLSDDGAGLSRFAGQIDYIEIGSAAMPIAQKRRLMELLPETRICMHYGLTEASRSAYLSFHDDREHLESIGRPSPGVDMRVVDDSGAECATGVSGRIQVRGGHVMTAYWEDTELTSQVLRDGWLETGDLGHRDADGYFHLMSRASDIINVGGRKVSPEEIESILCEHPGISECACVGLPDPQGLSGEIISAFLVARPGIDKLPTFAELAKLLREHLESYKIPRRFTWIDTLPKSSSGKILRRELKNSN